MDNDKYDDIRRGCRFNESTTARQQDVKRVEYPKQQFVLVNLGNLPIRYVEIAVRGGIIGTTTAYFLTRHPSFNPSIHHITLLEAATIAAGASGKAGGLLALWAYPMCIVPLSYRLHAELAGEHGGAERWGYRRLGCGQLAATVKTKDPKTKLNGSRRSKLKNERRRKSSSNIGAGTIPSQQQQQQNGQSPIQNGPGQQLEHDPQPQQNGYGQKEWQKLPKQDEAASSVLHESLLPADLDWINSDMVGEYAEMGLPGYIETAQVHPLQFTTAMAELARSGGTETRTNAQVTKIGLNASETAVRSVEYTDRVCGETRTIHGVTDVVLAAGPWTGRLLPRSRVEGVRAHSVVFAAEVSPYAVFTNITLPANFLPAHRAARGERRRRHKSNVDPEIYARPGREVYACGELDPAAPLPETADQVECDESQCDDLVAYIGTVSRVLGAATVAAKQACYMPRHMRPGQESTPLVGGTCVDGLWVAAGHTCWGIQNGPATGKLMSEFIFEGAARSADASELDPRQFKI
ncbi:Uu.00g084560.m01.CDS01 [Anthostomella pinea]|uniref:Uu.00g084560.m01.CDS01 n=1 Tax=Anthostomella pinea TaxID=933095 RepID=A0AAI8VMY0_9PEZI|nr:Uu.00g084560.m01.CDS01 [Anthostomella pinea]